ncbi:hypothetical protein ACHAXT_002351 [Thalassiosira profunda]
MRTMETKRQHRYLQKVLDKLARDDAKTKEVVLNGFRIGNEPDKMAQLAMSLVSNTHIKVLSLNNCSINSKGAHLLAYALDRNTSLDHVWLCDNQIGSSGAKAISTALARSQTLLSIGLANNVIGNSGGRVLAKAIATSQSIEDIFVEGNKMSPWIEDEITKICYGEESDEENEIEEFDACTVAETIVSMGFVDRALASIKEVEYESDSAEDDASTASSVSDGDIDFTSYYQRKREGKLSKLKKAVSRRVMRRKVKPGFE